MTGSISYCPESKFRFEKCVLPTGGQLSQSLRQIWLVAIAWIAVSPALLFAQGTTVVGGQGALLMKHGDVISGELAPMGDQISVRIDENNSVFIPVRQIEYSAGSVLEIYQYKMKKYGRIGTGEHYQMALWCLKNKLNDQAILHYEELKRMIPNDPIVKRLAIQIKETILQEPWAKEVIRQQTQQKATSSNANSVVTASGNSSQGGGVQTAGGSSTLNHKPTPATSPGSTSTQRPQSIPKSNGEPSPLPNSNSAAKPMTFEPYVSDEAAKLFRSHLQPILIQKCGQSGCHGAQATNQLKLLRPNVNSTKKTAETNIASLVPFIDAADANKSKLYQLATRPHGPQKTGSIGQIDNDGSDELLGWLRLVIYQTQQNQMAGMQPGMPLGPNGLPLTSGQSGSPHLWQQHLDRIPGGAAAGLATGDRPSLNDAPVVSVQNYDSLIQKPFMPDISKEVTPSELDRLEEEVRRAEAAEKGEVVSSNPPTSGDPFDPNAFNNQYRKPE
ncbi:MAG: helix-loop-helix domain-containing protein [Planctomycetaceae bacterium]|nr:helix-loop-helix domain-containing protein [Planctomycetaceae bacterium]